MNKSSAVRDPARVLVPWLLAACSILLTARYALVTWQLRAPWNASYPYENDVMTDFRDTVMLPGQAVTRGLDPYDIGVHKSTFPHAQEFDPYMPWWLTVTGPLSRLDWASASLVWSFVLAVATSACAFWAGWRIHVSEHHKWHMPRRVTPFVETPCRLGLVFVIVQWLWRPTTVGQGLGNVGALVSIFALCALLGRRDSWWAPFLALAWVKPQFGIPLVIILLVRGQWRRAVGGTALAVVASIPMTALLAHREGGFGQLVAVVLDAVSHLGARSDSEPLKGRVDLDAWLSTTGLGVDGLTPMVAGSLLLVLAVWLSSRLQENRPDLATGLTVLGLLVGFPHLHYDLAILSPLIVWLVLATLWGSRGRACPWLFLSCFLVTTFFCIGLLPGYLVLGGVGFTQVQGHLVRFCYAVFLAFAAWMAWRSRESMTVPDNARSAST